MSKERKKLGSAGEEMALKFLLAKGYRLIEKNLRLKVGEIDLLMQDNQTLVICEVKTQSNSLSNLPQEKVDFFKQKKLRLLAKSLSQFFPNRLMRIDVVAVDESLGKIDHIVNAVEEH